MLCSLSLFSVKAKYTVSLISLGGSGTRIPGSGGTGFVVEGTSGHFTCCLFFRFISEMKTNTSTFKSTQ